MQETVPRRTSKSGEAPTQKAPATHKHEYPPARANTVTHKKASAGFAQRLIRATTVVVSFLLLSGILWAQAGSEWCRQNDRGNRCEGRRGVQVGGPILELLSFTGRRQRYPLDTDVVLQVRFFLATDAEPTVIARELQERQFYWMESKPPRLWNPPSQWWVGKWNMFDWPTKDVIRPLRVPWENLGVIVALDPGPRSVAPAFVHSKGTTVSEKSQYLVFLRPGIPLKGGRYALYRIRGQSEDLVATGTFGAKPSDEAFAIVLDLQPTWEGPANLHIEAVYRDQPGSIVRDYRFYHRPREEE